MADDIQTTFTPEEIEEGKGIAWAAYLLFFIPLLVKPDNRFCKAHVKQGLALTIVYFACAILVITWVLIPVLWVLDIIALIKALNGEYWKIPGIGILAEKFTF
jgi:uncharacterized membrane protein